MSKKTAPPRTAEQLEADMELAFREGDLGQTALCSWEITARFPDNSFGARVYKKKLLRDSYIQGLSMKTLDQNALELMKGGDAEEIAKIAALGLLQYPDNRNLSMALVHAAQKLGRPEWIRPAITPLGSPQENDHAHFNAAALAAWVEGKHEQANNLFYRAVSLQPKNEIYVRNYGLSLKALDKPHDAIELFEENLPHAKSPADHILQLIPLYGMVGRNVPENLKKIGNAHFSPCRTLGQARAYVDSMLLAGEFECAEQGLHKLLNLTDDAGVAFELAELEIALGKYEVGLKRYGKRFEALPSLGYQGLSAAKFPYRGENLQSETLLLLGEQGLGDELFFSMLFHFIATRVRNVVCVVDPRLIPIFSTAYPDWKFVSRFSNPPIDYDFVCYAGDLLELFLQEQLISATPRRNIVVEQSYERADGLPGTEGNPKSQPMIGISWRGGGENPDGKMRSIALEHLLSGLGCCPEALLISLQYDGDHAGEVNQSKDPRLVNSGIDNRKDLIAVLGLVQGLDAVVTVDNSVAHIAAVLGIPVALLLPEGRVQFRWQNEDIRECFFPTVKIFRQEVSGDWAQPLQRAGEYVNNLVVPGGFDS